MTGLRNFIAEILVVFYSVLLVVGSDALQLSSGWALLSDNDDTNRTRSSASPGPRSGSSAWVDAKGHAWLFGGREPDPKSPGRNATTLLSDLWTYDPVSGIWQLRVSNSQHVEGREHAAICGFTAPSTDKNGNLTLVIFGGRVASPVESNRQRSMAEQYRASAEMLVLHRDQSEWRVITPETKWPPARYDALSWCDESAGTLSIVGGRREPDSPLLDAWILDLRTLTWRSVTPPATACAWTAKSAPPVEQNQKKILALSVHPKEGDTINATNVTRIPKFTDHEQAPRVHPPPLQLALAWRVVSDGSVFIMCDNETTAVISNNATSPAPPIDDPNIQLWNRAAGKSDGATPSWRLLAESGRGAQQTWPGTHRHGGTCTDTSGNLWLFAGQSQLGGHRYLNNDVWSYDVASNAWLKVEMPSDDSAEPEQRHLSAVWCLGDAMLVYGGLTCDEDDVTEEGGSLAECIRGDLWMLNFSVPSSPPRQAITLPIPQTRQSAPAPEMEIRQRRLPVSGDQVLLAVPTLGTTMATTEKPRPSTLESTIFSPTSKKTTPPMPQKSDWLTANRIPTDAPDLSKSSVERKSRPTATVALETHPTSKSPAIVTTKSAAVKSTAPSLSASPPVVLHSSKAFNRTAGASLTLDSGSGLHSEIPGPHSVVNRPTRQEVQGGSDHGAYGSAIFFGFSLSIFAIFGMVLFFRRCVSCPPRENSLLKEAPPVRYTVIPDDNYSI